MSDTKHAGRYLAENRGAFQHETAQEITASVVPKIATAPLAETAVMHMEPERIVAFIRWMEGLAE